MSDYMGMRWTDLVVIPLDGKTGRELEELLAVALKRAVNSSESPTIRAEAELLENRVRTEQERRANRLMLRIAFIGLMVTGAAALADLVPKVIGWIAALVQIIRHATGGV